jgi:hypothetical protein
MRKSMGVKNPALGGSWEGGMGKMARYITLTNSEGLQVNLEHEIAFEAQGLDRLIAEALPLLAQFRSGVGIPRQYAHLFELLQSVGDKPLYVIKSGRLEFDSAFDARTSAETGMRVALSVPAEFLYPLVTAIRAADRDFREVDLLRH